MWAAGAAALALAVLLAPRLYVADLEDALVEEANAVVAAPRPRPSHVDAPRPGSLADGLRGPLPRYERAWTSLQGAEPERAALLTAVAAGAQPVSALSRPVRSGLAAIDGELDAVLAASRAERADLGPDHDPWGPLRGGSWLGLQGAAKHAALRMRLASTAAERARAVVDCLDALALGRDAAVSGGLVGRMVRAGAIRTLTAACAEAIAGLTASGATDAAARLRRIRDAVPSYGAMLREEMVQVRLLAYGRDLPEAKKARLLARPRAFADDASMAATDRLGRWRNRLGWRDLRRFQERLVEAGARPAPERDASFAAIDHTPALVALLFTGAAGPDAVESYARYARRDAAAELELDLLVAAAAARAARAQAGTWPSSAGALVAAGLLRPDEAGRLGRLVMAEDALGALELILPLPAADGTPAETVVRLTAPGDERPDSR